MQMYNIIELVLANFSDLDNVCNKTSMSLTNAYRSFHCEGTQIHCEYFFMSSPETDYETCRYIFAVDVPIYQTKRYYIISTKHLHKNAGILVKYYSYPNLVENIIFPNFANIHLKLAIFLTSNLKRFATGVTAF